MDWNIIKAEYIAGGTSYRKLAKKYEVSFNTIQGVAKREKWVDLKNQAKDKSTTKMVNDVAKDIAKNSVSLSNVCDKVLKKIEFILENYEEIDTQAIKHITSSLKDIKDIKGVKSDIDLKEQNARIDKLRKDIKTDKMADDKPCGVVLMPPIMESPTPPSEEENDG